MPGQLPTLIRSELPKSFGLAPTQAVAQGRELGQALVRQADEDLPLVRFPTFAGTGFHILLRGSCWLISANEPVALAPGDIVFTSASVEHGLSSVPCALRDLPLVAMGPIPSSTEPFGFEFVCGAYRLNENGRAVRYLRALPSLFTVSPDYDHHPEMRALASLLHADRSQAQPGTEAALPALLDLILVYLLRRWQEQSGPAAWPATDDAAVTLALREIHENPQRQWTVQRLSATAGLPRTVFTRRFTTAVGQPPMRYLIGWRLSRGAQLLRETDAPLATIAGQVGYSTEFSFSAAFRREYGVSPGRFRRTPAVAAEGPLTP